MILHDLLDACEDVAGGVVLVVGVLELPPVDVPFEDVPLAVAPTKLAIAGPGKVYRADVLKT